MNRKSPLTIVDLSIFPFNSISFCIIYFEALFDVYTFRILMLFWWMDLLILMQCSSLFLAVKIIPFTDEETEVQKNLKLSLKIREIENHH